MTERGEIKYPDRFRQAISYKGLQLSGTTITPTDIDGIMEYHDKAWIMIEAKLKGVELPFGQKTLMERFVKDGQKSGKQNLAIVVEHEVHNTKEVVEIAEWPIKEVIFYEGNKVVYKPDPRSLNECINAWKKKVDMEDESA